MIFDIERTLRIINEAPNPHIIKIFFYLVLIYGYVIDKIQLQHDLNLGRTNFLSSLRWLKDNIFVHELKFVDKSDFMVNPFIVMNNGDKDARINEWRRRQHLDIEKEIKNRKRKLREQLKKQNQQ